MPYLRFGLAAPPRRFLGVPACRRLAALCVLAGAAFLVTFARALPEATDAARWPKMPSRTQLAAAGKPSW